MNKTTLENGLSAFYLLFLGATLGGVLVLGIFTAPVVFSAGELLGVPSIGRFQSGIVMTEIFVRFANWVNLAVIAVLAYETREILAFRRDLKIMAAAMTTIFSGGLYTLFYMPWIVNAQHQGASVTGSEAFENMHKGAELDFKIFALGLLILFLLRIWTVLKFRR